MLETQDKLYKIMHMIIELQYEIKEFGAEFTNDYHQKSWEEREPDTIKKILEVERHINNAVYIFADIAISKDIEIREDILNE